MSSNDREFLGITQNEAKLQGKVYGDPMIHGEAYAFFWLRTSVGEKMANGSWQDVIIDVPVMTTDPQKVSTINQYIKDGRELLVDGYYKAWQSDQGPAHAFIVKKLTLGRKKWEPDQQQNSGAPSPPPAG